MADVMTAFLSGHQAGQNEQLHAQALEENKLRTLVLKHQIEGLKIEDQMRARAVAESNLQLLHGQPESDIPSTNVTTAQPNLPSTSLAGMVSGLVRGRTGLDDTGGGDAPVSTPAPAAQATAPGTNDVTRRVATPIAIPGVAGLGVPGVSVRPRSMEDLVRAQIATEMAKPYTLNPGATRKIGGATIGTGEKKLIGVPAGGLADEATGTIVTPGPGRVVRPIAGTVNGKEVFATPTANGGFTVNGQPAPAFVPRPSAAAAGAGERKANQEWQRNFRQYSGEVSQGQKAHADALKEWQKAAGTAVNGVDIATGKPIGDAPTFTPPSFDEWLATRDAAGGGAGAKKPAAAKSVAQPADPLQAADPATGTIYRFPTKAAADGYRKEKSIK